ncbi:hypothetical protein PsYK624_112440 [Phanerochaete sordida]|uniref:DNA breaking-rejoining enzyme n=1 Tax=Phanerochaete sordida TaxID=48140 RepID=A0A9P3LH81_9APHY|nr:hypothetical protein PsYK624_112440 [Phanerochaete sordida]
MFGLRSSAGVFGSVADMLLAIYRAAGFDPICKWVDDFLVIQLPGQTWTEDDFIALTARLGVPWATEKTRKLASRQQYIGFVWDLEAKSVSLPSEKLEDIHALLGDWLRPRARFTMREAARLHGKLIHVSCIYPLLRPFIRSASRFASSYRDPRAHLHVPGALSQDLRQISRLLKKLPAELPLEEESAWDVHWWGDASTSFGIGVSVGEFWNVWTWAPGVSVGPKQRYDIGWAEAVAVELGLLSLVFHGLLAQRPAAQAKVLVRSDNLPVVSILNSGRSRSQTSNDVLRRIYGACAENAIHLHAVHVPSRDNVTDALSRGDIVGFLAGFPQATTRSSMPLPSHLTSSERLQLRPSSLRPPCKADQRIFRWRGVHTPPPTTIDVPILQRIASLASAYSLRDASSYGSGIRKFHIFCDVFSVPEADRLPASFALLNSFALWAATDPSRMDLADQPASQFETVEPTTVRKYLSAVAAWHVAQGWPDPLSKEDHERIHWHLRGLENLQGSRRRPPRPPITLRMLAALQAELDLSDPFDACVWAIACCAFWGLMRFGEVTVKSRAAFDPDKHLTRGDADFDFDLDGKPFFRLNLRAAKTAQPGEVQQVFLAEQGLLCPQQALFNLARVVPAGASAPLFSWRDSRGAVRPMVRERALERINEILSRRGWGTMFGHSFRIGGASFLLGQGVSPEVVRILGRWRSLAYEAYIRAFEQVSSRHVGHLADGFAF